MRNRRRPVVRRTRSEEGPWRDPLEEAKGAAEADAASDDRFNRLVRSLGGTATASAVFGDPVEKGGVTIVPVARVRFGVGGGFGRGPGKKKRDEDAADQVGYGQGGGAQASPVGYIEISGGEAEYKRIVDPVRPMAVLMLFPLVGVLCFGLMAVIGLQSAKSAQEAAPGDAAPAAPAVPDHPLARLSCGSGLNEGCTVSEHRSLRRRRGRGCSLSAPPSSRSLRQTSRRRPVGGLPPPAPVTPARTPSRRAARCPAP